MSVHSSLRTRTSAQGSLRNVLKRHERVRQMMVRGAWTEGRSVYGLPKLKQMRMKARKAASAAKDETAAEKAAASPQPNAPKSP